MATHNLNKHASRFKDAQGEEHGNWTIHEYAYTLKAHAYYRCTCSCGTERIMDVTGVRSGVHKSCGCLRKQQLLAKTIENCPEFPCIPGVAFSHCDGLVGHAVSDNGIVWTCRKTWRIWKILNGSRDKDGYKRFNMTGSDGRVHYTKACILIATAFHGPRPDGLVVRHLDGDNHNDAAANLAWGTVAENTEDTMRHGRHHCLTIRGENAPNVKLTESQVVEIRERWPAESVTSLARAYGVTHGTISYIVHRKRWRHC